MAACSVKICLITFCFAPGQTLRIVSNYGPSEVPDDPADAMEWTPSLTEKSIGTNGTLPSVLLIGLPHAGSTSLAENLHQHPQLSYGRMKEHCFFATRWARLRNYKSVQEFQQTFMDDRPSVRHFFDGSPFTMFLGNPNSTGAGSFFRPPGLGAIEAVRDMLGPNLRIVVLIRDPVDHLLSVYGRNALFSDKLSWRTCYADSLENWIKVFGRDSLLVLKSESFFTDPEETLKSIYEFLDVATIDYKPDLFVVSGRRRTNKKVGGGDRRAFHASAANRACKQRLEQLTSMKFDWAHAS